MAAVLPAAPVGSCPGLPLCQSLPVSHVCVPLSHVCSTPCFIMRLSMTFLCPCWGPSSRGGGVVWGRLSDFTFTSHFHALEKEMATHSSVLAWRIPGTGEPGGLLSMGSHVTEAT